MDKENNGEGVIVRREKGGQLLVALVVSGRNIIKNLKQNLTRARDSI